MPIKTEEEERRITVTRESIDIFLRCLKTNGARPGTVRAYQDYLRYFLEFLPEGEPIAKDTLSQWRDAMRKEGVPDGQIRSRISGVNKYLEFHNLSDFRLHSQRKRADENGIPEISREEYLRLLRTAWRGEKMRNYLIMKTLCATGIGVSDLARITIDDVNAGEREVGNGLERRVIAFPVSLRREMRDYADQKNLTGGDLLFVSRGGGALTNRTVFRMMQDLSERAGVRKSVATPKHLRMLYRKTYGEIQELINAQVDQIYDNLLENELLSIKAGFKDTRKNLGDLSAL